MTVADDLGLAVFAVTMEDDGEFAFGSDAGDLDLEAAEQVGLVFAAR